MSIKGGIYGSKFKKQKYDMDYAKTHLKRIPLDVQIEKYEEIKSHAESKGESVNGFIKRAIDEAIQKDIAEYVEDNENSN